MSCGRAIDGDEPLFDFDASEDIDSDDHPTEGAGAITSTMPPELFDMSFIPQFAHLDLSSCSAASTPAEVVDYISRAQLADTYGYYTDSNPVEFESYKKGKGKAVSMPVDIAPRDKTTTHFDLFSFNNGLSGPSHPVPHSPVISSSVSPPHSPDYFSFSPTSDVRQGSVSAGTSYATDITTPGSSFSRDAQHLTSIDAHVSERVGKGKARAEPPSLPPLQFQFNPTAFSQGETNWPIEFSGSPASSEVLNLKHQSSPPPATVAFPVCSGSPATSRPSSPVPRHAPRNHSFPSLSSDALQSLPPPARNRSKVSLISGKRRGNLARRLLLSRCDAREFDSDFGDPTNTPIHGLGHPIYTSLSAPSTPRVSRALASSDACGRPVSLENSLARAPNLFENMLPREVKLEIFQTLLCLHEADGKLLTRSSTWTASKAAQREYRWTGKEKGLLELIRLSRVSKSWQKLVFDGQLWYDLDLKAFTCIPSPLLRRLASCSGSFTRSIDFTGHTRLNVASLLDLTNSFSISDGIMQDSVSTTQLTEINLSGCTALTTSALNDLISRSPCLVKANLKGLPFVTNETCKLLANHCPALSSLDLSRCHGVDAYGIISFFSPYGWYRTVTSLKCLRLAGLKRAGDRLLSTLGEYAPNLEVLDLSGARELHNTALELFVAYTHNVDPSRLITLTSREAGRNPSDPTKIRRRVTNLRHLSLSYCPLLTDHACSHLAHAMPKLEFLELAGIGAELKDDGLIRLLNTTPLIRRLDLDEACEITDATLAALTPRSVEDRQSANSQEPELGSRLEVLNLSYAVELSNDALLSLIRNCTRLVHLELDSTRVTGTTVKEFVRLARKRQAVDAEIVVVDCRHVGDGAVKDLVGSTRTRKGWKAWEAQILHYLDARDDEDLGVGTDECDDKRVALKSFYQWQTVDAVEAAREKRRKAKKNGSKAGSDDSYFATKRPSSRWWSPGSRRSSGSASPVSWASDDREREGCIIM